VAPDRMAVNVAIDTLLLSYPEDVQILARQARETLREWLPNAEEGVDASADSSDTATDLVIKG
jgi:hypothetical protein